ncbi:hypothetical protein GBA65_03210 [Rubrobacter marinus]|uniref:Sulfotransferase n=1 Tax=Rubrobacter marinus TaxID=2653852 RepID=A0A6G8PUA4_9ACTN|nr:sulfotransferase [Rubrobacter marinus]QIN77682.1 hypothetical protein GBA65_03210 [Rubrobacter marinus]
MEPNEPPVKVLYVLGDGRSGSTVLDIVLGNHPGVESVGEVRKVPTRGWEAGNPCSCGRPMGECPFWSEVHEEWVRRVGSDDLKGFRKLQGIYESRGGILRLLAERARPSERFRRYARLNGALFGAIRAVSGKSVVVDSSKVPARALALSSVPGVELHLVHLIRDARGVAASRKKSDTGVASTPAWRSSMRWTEANLLSEWVRRRVDPAGLRVRYEDLAADPRRELGRIGTSVGLDLSGLAEGLLAGREMRVGHVGGGNRVRMAGTVRFSGDTDGWRTRLSEGEQRAAWTFAAPLMKRHGYKR